MARETQTPTEFIIECMESLDDVEQVVIIRKHKCKGITFDCNTHTRTDIYALTGIVKLYVQGDIVADEVREG
jgi:hypothetical protein